MGSSTPRRSILSRRVSTTLWLSLILPHRAQAYTRFVKAGCNGVMGGEGGGKIQKNETTEDQKSRSEKNNEKKTEKNIYH